MTLVVCTSWSAKVPEDLFLMLKLAGIVYELRRYSFELQELHLYTISGSYFLLTSSPFEMSNTDRPQYKQITTGAQISMG